MPARNFRRPAAAIIAALSVDSARLGRNVGISRRSAALVELGAQAAVGRHAAGDADALRLIAPGRVEQSIDQRRRRRRAGSWRTMSAISSCDSGRRRMRSRTWRSTAVFRPLKLKSRSPFSSGAFRSACVSRVVGSAMARSLPVLRQAIDHRAARIAEPEQLRDLVVRLPRRIVSGAAEQLILAGPLDQIQARVAARHDEHDRMAAAARRSAAPATRCVRPDDARRRAAGRPPRPRPWRTTHRPAAIRRGPGPA